MDQANDAHGGRFDPIDQPVAPHEELPQARCFNFLDGGTSIRELAERLGSLLDLGKE